MRRRFILALVVGAAVASGCASSAAERSGQANASFARMKALAGTWVTVQEEGTEPAGRKVRYQVTSGGSALVEISFLGTTGEMVSVYTVEDGDLVLTHYCALRNQPRMRAMPPRADGVLAFEFDGGANLDADRDTHMHRVEFAFADESHMRTEWTLYERGHPVSTVRLALVRTYQ
jgi:hypothetical protein